jgi:ParB family chromosome partitioning protein
MKIEQVPIDRINVGERFRVDMGDLESLAASIRDIGLLQAIGIDSYYRLIFGYRRLCACQEILQWESIPCAVVNVDSVIAGEYAENEFRKQFTLNERKAIVDAILSTEEKRKSGPKSNCAADAAQSKGRALDDAAKKVGFSADTYSRVKKVAEKGIPELGAALDAGQISPSVAAVIADQPKEKQAQIIAMPTSERREILKQANEDKRRLLERDAREQDIKLFRGLHRAVELIAGFVEDPHETWAGLSRVRAYEFSGNLHKAIQCLVRIEKAHPNGRNQPQTVAQKV